MPWDPSEQDELPFPRALPVCPKTAKALPQGICQYSMALEHSNFGSVLCLMRTTHMGCHVDCRGCRNMEQLYTKHALCLSQQTRHCLSRHG